MTDSELDALDAFLSDRFNGNGLPDFRPSQYAENAEEVREKWLRGGQWRSVWAAALGPGDYPPNAWAARADDPDDRGWAAKPPNATPGDSLRLAELLAIARACGWEK